MGKDVEVESTPLYSPVVQVPVQPNPPQTTYIIALNNAYQANPNVVYASAPPTQFVGYPQQQHQQIIYIQSPVVQVGPWNGTATASMILFILSACGIWLCSLPSIILSLQLVSKKVIPERHRAGVIACSIIELIGFFFVPSISWYGQTICDGWSYDRTYCYYFWLGWIGIVIWWVFTIACGIPRTIYTFRARNNLPESCC